MAEIFNDSGSSGKIISSSNIVQSKSIGDLVQDRVLPRQISTGSTRGTQTVGYGSVKIDGSNNRIDLEANDTRVIIGDVSDTNDVTGLGFYDNTNTLRLLGGTFPDGSVKIKLSQDGKDVSTASDDELIWSSDFNLFKIISSDTASGETTDASPDLAITVLHDLGEVPGVIVFAQPPSTSLFAPLTVFPSSAGGYVPVPLYLYTQTTIGGSDASVILFSITYEVNETSLILRAHQGVTGLATSTFPVSFRYYILKETAKTEDT